MSPRLTLLVMMAIVAFSVYCARKYGDWIYMLGALGEMIVMGIAVQKERNQGH